VASADSGAAATVPVSLPAPANIVKTTSGQTSRIRGRTNPAPKIAIVGSGDIDLWIGTQLVELAGVDTGYCDDSEAMDCYAADGVTLDNGKGRSTIIRRSRPARI
jgi:hypothetical protein